MKYLIILLILLISIGGVSWWYYEEAQSEKIESVSDLAKKIGTTAKDTSQVVFTKSKSVFDKVKDTFKSINQKTNSSTKDIEIKSEPKTKYSDQHLYAGEPTPAHYPNPIKVLKNDGYLVGYDDVRKNPAWVAYRLFKNESNNPTLITTNFITDKRTSSKVTEKDFNNTGFSKCLLAPASAIVHNYGEHTFQSTKLMSNIVAMEPDLYSGPWSQLEKTIANQYKNSFYEVWVITGPLYAPPIQKLNYGIEVPDFFYKIILDAKGEHVRAIGFIMPQTSHRHEPLQNFIVTIDEIQERSGLHFFTEIEEATQSDLKSTLPSDVW